MGKFCLVIEQDKFCLVFELDLLLLLLLLPDFVAVAKLKIPNMLILLAETYHEVTHLAIKNHKMASQLHYMLKVDVQYNIAILGKY